MRLVLAATLLLITGPAWAAESTCSGALIRTPDAYQVEGCNLTGANAQRVLRACSPGRQCVVTGTPEHCKGIRGACLELKHVTDAHWGKPLPACTKDAALSRADKWWSEGSSVIVEGTIAARAKNEGETPSFGRTTIVMDLTECSTGAAMPIDRVADQWIGHYVHVQGTARKGDNGWYIIANDVQAVK